MSGGNEKKMVTLKSSDGKLFPIEEAAAAMSEIIRNMIEGGVVDDVPIPMHNVEGEILAKVAEYCSKHAEAEARIGERAAALPGSSRGAVAAAADGDGNELRRKLKHWDAVFIADVSQDVLFGLAEAANYMCIRPLLDLSCQKVADIIKDMTPEEVREMFGIENDFTVAEEEALAKQDFWSYTP